MKLFKIRIAYEVVVAAENVKHARQVAERDEYDIRNDPMMLPIESIVEVETLGDLSEDWKKSRPYGDAEDRSCEEFFK